IADRERATRGAQVFSVGLTQRGKTDVLEINGIGVRWSSISRKADDLPGEVLGIIQHQGPAVPTSVGELDRRRTRGADLKGSTAVDRQRARIGWWIVENRASPAGIFCKLPARVRIVPSQN